MEHERKGFSFRQFFLTIGLLCILLTVIWLEISVFISGPAIHYDEKIAAQQETILNSHREIKELDRHVFAYVIYSGADQENYYWFNENGEQLTTRSLAQLDYDKAIAVAEESYGMKDCKISIGYGYERPVYRIENASFELYLDIDSLEQVFFRMKEEGRK